MVSHVFPISSDSTEESVGSHVPQVILFGTIRAIIHVAPIEVPIVPTVPLVIPEVGAIFVTSPAKVLDLADYSSSYFDPSKESFLQHQSYHWFHSSCVLMTQRVLSRPSLPSRSSYHDTLAPSFEFLLSLLFPTWDSSTANVLIRPGEAILSIDLTAPILIGRTLSAPLSTPYPPMTSESSTDSSSKRSLDSYLLSAGSSGKRCRSLTTSHIKIDTADAEAVVDLGIGDGVGAHTKDGIGCYNIAASDIREDEEEFEAKASVGGTMEMVVDPLVTSGIPEQLEASQLMASGERCSLTNRVRALLCIERDQVDSLCHHIALSQEQFHQIRKDHDDARGRLRILESFVERSLGFRP
nr:hypothetical protein [Tanacetum cinerariifolium]